MILFKYNIYSNINNNMNTEEKFAKRLKLNKIARDSYLKRKNEGRLTTLIPIEQQKPRGRPFKLDKKHMKPVS